MNAEFCVFDLEKYRQKYRYFPIRLVVAWMSHLDAS